MNEPLSFTQSISDFVIQHGFSAIIAAVILVVGLVIARRVFNVVLTIGEKHQLDITLSKFFANIVRVTIIVMAAITALTQIGISITPLMAAVGALSLGAGLAVQGLVSNYGAGLNIILTRTFVVGDTVEVAGVKGIVSEIHLGYTLLHDEDDILVMVPNKHIIGEVIKNSKHITLIETSVMLDNSQPIEQAISLIEQAVAAVEKVDKQQPIEVGIDSFSENHLVLNARFWAHYSGSTCIKQSANLAIYRALTQANIQLPTPKLSINSTQPMSKN